jgi:glycosyltransferase involved in cell wall biosynthesis
MALGHQRPRHNLLREAHVYSAGVSPDRNGILFVTELSGHGDEGMRNWIKTARRALLAQGCNSELLRLAGDARWSALLPSSLRSVRRAAPDVLVYVPYSGLTSKALLRHAALRAASGSRTDILAVLQANPVVHRLPRRIGPRVAAYASERLRAIHTAVAGDSFVLPPAVDAVRFCLADESRTLTRAELGLPSDKPMALHVGHLRRSRGLEPLTELSAQGVVNVVLVASTATEPEEGVEAELRQAGVIVKREFLRQIERWYQAADVYVFPVTDLQGSIEVPLTVLEAMACGTPVATTPFGGLPSWFASTESFRFAPVTELAKTARAMVGVDGRPNRSVLVGMDEDALGGAVVSAIRRVSSRG